ncbi:DinB superfamily protein [Streptoalloteichus tenebrarius]|uniref:DinB superfamily protein n=1 Tax=Streptoalloteichus tenebrarius (strain ATCC 17920 / DSM 40477 / JCM 4838 / CBS 697.72 / NBRC 16177 / NCIMB 11028 / NRRL B-12390 / A12253. 1 / ISP 5477) TaxID=1933 RepID=A0ABT1HMQ5_STRSD|nr:DinB family protein [Streptoalloteichus tenebrarius]MCP2256802.1 DinB superfamily protein [Streptoalloteichus tenebrarius]BFF00292.1 DinB family protein [Streptoalloteichus tenebrarius]
MPVDWRSELVAQLDWYWTNQFRPRLAGLTDDEYLWEPVAGCWSVRPTSGGRHVCDWVWPEPSPPPVTTIAWRIAHIGGPVLGMRASRHFGDGSFDLDTVDWPGTAAAGLDFLDRHHAAWAAGLATLDEDDLARPCGPAEGPFAAYPLAALVLHINREVHHHGAEVALLRDLYRASAAGTRWAPPAPHRGETNPDS